VDKLTAKIALQCLFVMALLVLGRFASAESEQQIGQRLLESAQKDSDIRTEGSQAFRMDVKFRVTSKSPAKETEGKYAEIWVSKVKWHREVETSSFHRLEVGLSSGNYYLDSGIYRPDTLSDRMLLRFPITSREIQGLSEREVSGMKASCVESKALGAKNLDCIDPTTGTFLSREIQYSSGTEETCWYRDYQKFGERSFPRSVHCVKKPGDEFELTISRLATESSPDENLFTKPPGALQVANCQGHRVMPAKVTYNPQPTIREPIQESQTVVVSAVVGVEGKSQDLWVTRSAGKNLDQAALDAVRLWTFKPATCEGKPIPVAVIIEVNFRKP
jgi:TonB family protein